MKILKTVLSFISRLSKRERLILYATLAVVGIGLVDRLIITPILGKMRELDETITMKEEAIEQSLLIVTQEKRIESESEQYVSYLSEPQAEEKEVTNFLREVENIAKQSSVYLVDVKPAGGSSDGVATRYFVKLNFEAQMEQAFHFFHNITTHEQLLKVESFEINPKTEGSSVVACGMSVSKTIIPE